MLAFSESLNESLRRAVALAERLHKGAMPEHLLVALTDDPDAAPVMKACHVDLEKLRGAVMASMSGRDERPLPDETVPRSPQGFQGDIQRAFAHAQSIARRD